MKNLTIISILAFGLASCATTSSETSAVEVPAVSKTAPAENAAECAVVNEDGTCACEVVDEFGQCVEGGGTGVIIG